MWLKGGGGEGGGLDGGGEGDGGEGLGGSGEGDGGLDGDGGGARGGGDKGGDSLQAAASSRPRELVSSATFCSTTHVTIITCVEYITRATASFPVYVISHATHPACSPWSLGCYV